MIVEYDFLIFFKKDSAQSSTSANPISYFHPLGVALV